MGILLVFSSCSFDGLFLLLKCLCSLFLHIKEIPASMLLEWSQNNVFLFIYIGCVTSWDFTTIIIAIIPFPLYLFYIGPQPAILIRTFQKLCVRGHCLYHRCWCFGFIPGLMFKEHSWVELATHSGRNWAGMAACKASALSLNSLFDPWTINTLSLPTLWVVMNGCCKLLLVLCYFEVIISFTYFSLSPALNYLIIFFLQLIHCQHKWNSVYYIIY